MSRSVIPIAGELSYKFRTEGEFMFKLSRFSFSGALLAALALPSMAPSLAMAQSYDDQRFAQSNDMDLQASVTFRIPLGATNRRQMSDQARVGFGLSLARNGFDSPLGRLGHDRLMLLDIGAYGFKTPSVEFSGQELYGPTFIALHADEDGSGTNEDGLETNDTASRNLMLIGGAVAVVTVGSLVLINEAADDFNDCFFVFTDVPDKCRD